MTRRDHRKRTTQQTRRRSQRLRSGSTYPERRLWSALSGKQVSGVRFRRQHPIESFIVDFYCAAARIAIELVGENHEGREHYDRQRTASLEDQGVRVLRVTNDEVLNNLGRGRGDDRTRDWSRFVIVEPTAGRQDLILGVFNQ